MGKYFSDDERLNLVKELKRSGKNVSEFAREKGISRSTLRDWVHAYDNIGGTFVRIKDVENIENALINDKDLKVNMLSPEQISNKSRHFSGFDHSVVVIEYKSIKITTSLEQALRILENMNV